MNDRRASAVWIAVTLVLFVGCGGTALEAEPERFEWHGAVSGVSDWSNLTADAAMRWTEGESGFTAAIELRGDRPGAVRPWHVHVNSCAEGGGIFGQDGHYPRLVIGADGTASQVVEVPMVPVPGAAYHVNVHRSEEEMSVIIACGDITLGGGGAPPPSIPGY